MATTINATSLGLESYGRTEYDGTEYVVYSDGAYRHVVTAASYDADHTVRDCDDLYTEWCGEVDFADDATSEAVGRQLGLTHVHSADGSCSRIDCE
jgi:hypothetical protein